MNIEKIIKRLKDRNPEPLDIKKEYSVIIPLININGNWELIYEVRSKSLNRQPGEISFPGGQIEIGETYRQAAIRETMEELNIGIKNIHTKVE